MSMEDTKEVIGLMGSMMEVVFIIIMSMEDTRVIGLMASMMAMVLRLGLMVTVTGTQYREGLKHCMVCVYFTQGICMQGNGIMGRLLKMAVSMLESLWVKHGLGNYQFRKQDIQQQKHLKCQRVDERVNKDVAAATKAAATTGRVAAVKEVQKRMHRDVSLVDV